MIYKNNSMELVLLLQEGDYALFMRHNPTFEGFDHIVVWQPVFNEDHVYWSQGYYDLSYDDAFALFTKKTF